MMKLPKRLSLIAVAAALAAAGTAYAVDGGKPDGGWNTTMTRAEAQAKAAEMFTRMDVNKDGKLDPADRDARHAAMFDLIDSDRNGQISRTEFTAHHQPPAGEPAAAGMGERPMRGEGMRHHGGHGRSHEAMGHEGMGHEGMGGHRMGGHGRMGMMMGQMADTNKDGAVSQAEFAAAAMAHFDKADADKDGKVTPEERKAARDAMRTALHQARATAAATAAPAN